MKTRKILSTLVLGAALSGTVLTSCKKDDDKTTTPTNTVANAISDAAPLKGAIKGTMVAGKTYKIGGDVFINKGDKVTIQEGVTIIVNGDGKQGSSPELVVDGNLYVYGTTDKPVTFTVDNAKKGLGNIFKGYWGGIQCTETAGEVVLLNTHIEYTGAPAEAGSPAVKAEIYDEGEPRYGLLYTNINGKLVMQNSRIAYSVDDGMRVTGGKINLIGNKFEYNGETGGEAINIKSGVEGNIAFNTIYSCATNGIKWSNSGGRSPQTDCAVYNNTVINSGWRRTKAGRGGSINIEKGARGIIYNNLIVNCKYGSRILANDPSDPGNTDGADVANTKMDYTWYYGYNDDMVKEFLPSAGAIKKHPKNDVHGKKEENDPKFKNYNVKTDISKIDWVKSYDFNLSADSKAKAGAKTDFSAKIATFSINGKVYDAPKPAAHFGAYPAK